jgi:hypothetical protein
MTTRHTAVVVLALLLGLGAGLLLSTKHAHAQTDPRLGRFACWGADGTIGLPGNQPPHYLSAQMNTWASDGWLFSWPTRNFSFHPTLGLWIGEINIATSDLSDYPAPHWYRSVWPAANCTYYPTAVADGVTDDYSWIAWDQ